jgi:hypothetical protein
MRKLLGCIAVGLFVAACVDQNNLTGPRPGSLRASMFGAPLPGAIFTTDVSCTGVDLNIYISKSAVYVDGGPAHPGAAGLPEGEYYIQVTAPDGTLLGTSLGTGDETPIVVDASGEFAQCYQLSAILIKASNGTAGYDDTPNPGGEYKVWISTVGTFDNSATKTDNFKVKNGTGCDPEVETCGPPPSGLLSVIKWYDRNADGIHDPGEALINGWKVNIRDGINLDRFTPVALVLDPDDYIVTEYNPVETNWIHTTATSFNKTVSVGGSETVEFGNVCTGPGGGLTLGFWSNKNGQALVGATDLAMLVGLNLRNADGTNFDPATYAAFRTWILSATATNMAYMLSAQLAAMELNVFNGKVDGSSLIYAPGTTSANALGFATVNAVMAEADASLGSNGLTNVAGPTRTYQEALKNALDNANNNLNFVQSAPCPFSFLAS